MNEYKTGALKPGQWNKRERQPERERHMQRGGKGYIKRERDSGGLRMRERAIYRELMR